MVRDIGIIFLELQSYSGLFEKYLGLVVGLGIVAGMTGYDQYLGDEVLGLGAHMIYSTL